MQTVGLFVMTLALAPLASPVPSYAQGRGAKPAPAVIRVFEGAG
jgi:hypothetical protein